MNPVLQRLKKPVLIGAGIILAMLAFAWLALPGIIQSQAEKFVAEKTGHRLTLAKPEIDPLALSVRLRELRLADPAGATLMAFGELFVDLSASSLTARTLVFDEIRLDGLNADLIQLKQGGLNWTPFLDALKSKEPEPESKGLPRLDIRHLRIGGAQVAFTDQRVSPAFATAIEPLDLELTDVSTLPDDAGRFKLDARTLLGAQLAWAGSVTLNPLASTGRIDLTNLDLGRLAPLLRDKLPIAPPAGRAALGADYTLTQKGSALDLSLEKASLTIADLRLQTVAGETTPQLAIDRLAIKNARFDLGTRQLVLGPIELQGNRFEAVLDKTSRKPVLTLDNIALTDASVDLRGNKAVLTAIAIKGGGVAAKRDANGRIDLLAVIDALQADSPAPKPLVAAAPAAPAKPEAPWHIEIRQVSLAAFALTLRDESVMPAVELGLNNIGIYVEGVSENLKAALPLKASLDVKSGGRLEFAGTVTPADAVVDLKIKLANLALKPVQPYVAKFAALELASGQVSAEGRVTRDAKTSGYRGSVAITDLRLNEAGSQNVFLAWKALSSEELQASPDQLTTALLTLDGLDTKIIINKDKSTNLTRVLRKNETADAPAPTLEAAPAAQPAADTAKARQEAPGFQFNIDRLRFRGGAMDFADNSLILPFATRIHGLRGSINGLASRSVAPAQVELDGEVDEFGQARAAGQVDFFKPADFMDLKVVFRNVDMGRLTPYTATFAGRKIKSGKLSLELEYKINKRQLLGENQIIIDRLELGERIESPTAKDLPLDLAIALLSDSDGRIELGLPISGSLDDPQFSYGQIVWKAISNVLGKLVTAPFRALGALFGGSGEKIDKVAFEAGAARLAPPEREKLVRLATALNKRPGLALSVHGTWAEADRAALQDRQLRRSVAAKSGQAVGEQDDPGPLSTGAPKIQAALESLFAARFGATELAALKDGFRKANPGQLEESLTGKMVSRLSGLMGERRSLTEAEVGQLKGVNFHALLFERLRAEEPVADVVLQTLALKRAEHAIENLKAAGAPEARISMGVGQKVELEGRDILLKLELGTAGG